jgi:bifunctional DNA-binding transcriptional regulator/antitoxin component of YhaV-PrlF toxin-antitoxin module
MLLRISKGGQVSIPAPIRKRWQTDELVAEDHGDRLILRPAPDDPIERASGALKGKLRYSSKEARRLARLDERIAEERKWGRS